MSSSNETDSTDTTELEEAEEASKSSRRDVLKSSVVGAGAIGMGGMGGVLLVTSDDGSTVSAMPTSEGWLLVDSEKCARCQSCMTACSLAHQGEANISLSRIQIDLDPLADAPDDITIAQCRQCVETYCVEVCPTGALEHNEEEGNVPMVEPEKCIGCRQCIEACPYAPNRMGWNFYTEKGQKCDLCIDTPYWEEEGGPDGKQACVESCPMEAIELTGNSPDQKGDLGYDVDLKPQKWGWQEDW